jgi:hypothetical protein
MISTFSRTNKKKKVSNQWLKTTSNLSILRRFSCLWLDSTSIKKYKFLILKNVKHNTNLIIKAELELLNKEAHTLLLKLSSKYPLSQNKNSQIAENLNRTPKRTDSMQNQKVSESLKW